MAVTWPRVNRSVRTRRRFNVDGFSGIRSGAAVWFLVWLLRLCQHTPLRGSGSYGDVSGAEGGDLFRQAEREMRLTEEIFGYFRPLEPERFIKGATVLDWGCGYGGRTVGYATRYKPKKIIGVEVFSNMVEKAQAYAAQHSELGVRFLLGGQTTIPLDTNSVDVVISFDVFEHVADPETMLAELIRVTRPGGHLLIVFTPYHGLLAHHLGYITRVPGIHLLFRAETIVEAVNRVLDTPVGQRFAMKKQPPAAPSHNGSRMVYGTLNGLTSQEFLDMVSRGPCEIVLDRRKPLLEQHALPGGAGAGINRLLQRISPLRDVVSFNFAVLLKVPASQKVDFSLT